jgi:metacaspase-1
MKKAICVGINNYPGIFNDLKGCVNDANDWAELLTEFDFEVNVLLDNQGTRENIKNALRNLVSSLKPGDYGVFTYSGHGTYNRDTSGDEPDSYDEALYVYDGILLDDELREILNDLNPQASLVVIADSCYSGTVTRVADDDQYAIPRFVPLLGYNPLFNVRTRFLAEAEMLELLLTGCSDTELSYDAFINGRYNGAMSRYAIDAIRANREATFDDFYSLLRQALPSQDYPQTPQLEGSDENKARVLFVPLPVEEPIPDPEPEPEPEPEPQPEPDSPGCLPGLMQQVGRFFKQD